MVIALIKGRSETMPAKTVKRRFLSARNFYLAEINKDKLLTASEEKYLSMRAKNGDKEARERLINSNLRLVIKIARGYINNEVDFLDLVQEGNLGLIRAVDKFDHTKNVRFSTYASFWIKQSIARAIINKSRTIKLPHRKAEKVRKLEKVYQQISKENGRWVEFEEIVKESKLDEKEVKDLMSLPTKVYSIEARVDDDAPSLLHYIEDPRYRPDNILFRNFLKSKAKEMMEILTEREKRVLALRYSFISGEKHTLKDIASKLNVSPETVRQIEIKALRKIREHFAHMKDFI